MRKFFFLFTFLVLSYTGFSLSILFNRFSGSLLCGDLALKTTLVDSLRKPLEYSYTIAISDTSNDLYVDHYLVSKKEADTLKEIYIDLNEEFSKLHERRKTKNWKVYEDYYLDGKKIDRTGMGTIPVNDAYPSRQCYTTKSTCNEIKVYRKTIREFCSPIRYHTKLFKNIVGDSLFVEFHDSTSTTDVVCLAEGEYIHTDSATISGLENQEYHVFKTDTTFLYCVVAGPGCGLWGRNEYLTSYDFTNCVINSFEDFNKESVAEYYPNPASDVLTIPEYSGEIELTNQMGSVYTIKGNEKFWIAELPQSVYVISTTGEHRRRLGKILIQ